ncbi:hypothetical protein [Pseudomonas cremoricolorata]|uniref:Lipoprotein n=1 Tax=Pseudomonas cremoricolorata TaxID=157783 RepID=A0A089WL79_9PSED|nr:hypothetical protein [Pseudomonas cremoricolorata]AIR90055.1 hypothetical protein LK03_12470 [Pseudomonas cremoricolorata]
MKKAFLISVFCLLLGHAWVQAAPAPFQLWQSKLTGRYLCSQHKPGEGWVWHAGPFDNAGCRPR